jgi:hypothetical protein
MRTLLVVALLAFAFVPPAVAQSPQDRTLPTQPPPAFKGKPLPKGPESKIPGLQPLPEPPPPPPGLEPDPALEPQVTIQRRGTETVEEFRINGRLYMVKVTPAHGKPYYLVDAVGKGDFTRYDSYDTGTRPPMWVIHQW